MALIATDTELNQIKWALYGDLRRWQARMIEKIQHDVQAMREQVDLRIERLKQDAAKEDGQK